MYVNWWGWRHLLTEIPLNRSTFPTLLLRENDKKNIIKLCRRFSLHKVNKHMQGRRRRRWRSRVRMLCIFMGMTSFTLKLKLCNFITSWKWSRAIKIFVKFFNMKLAKICKKQGWNFGHISPLKCSKNTADSFNVCYILHKCVTSRDKKEKLANASSVQERASVYKFSLLWQRKLRTW